MSDCRACAGESKRYQRIREAMRSLPKRTAPPELVLQLRVVASRARALSATAGNPWSRWRSRFKVDFTHLMRPVALPVLGGVCSALFLFSAMAPTFTPMFGMSKLPSPFDVPTVFITEPMVKCTAPVAFGRAEATVDVTLDETRDHQPAVELFRRRVGDDAVGDFDDAAVRDGDVDRGVIAPCPPPLTQ